MAAYDNIAFGALHKWDDAEGVRRAAADTGVLAVIERLSQGWDTRVSREYRHGAELSGGEWQRLALARALFGVASGAGILIPVFALGAILSTAFIKPPNLGKNPRRTIRFP